MNPAPRRCHHQSGQENTLASPTSQETDHGIGPTDVPGLRLEGRNTLAAGLDCRGLIEALGIEFEQMEIAEDCIQLAQDRHGELRVIRDASGRVITEKGHLWRSFLLLQPTHPLQRKTEWLYREQCREILDRVAKREDTRPGTGVEVILALMETSLKAPLSGPAGGLYLRLFHHHFPDKAREVFREFPRDLNDYETMYASAMDDLETHARRKLQQRWRRLPQKDSTPPKPPPRALGPP